MIETLPEKCVTCSDYLFLTNLYVASQEKLYSKLKQIQRHEYTWITDDIKRRTMDRLNHHLGHEFEENNNTIVEKQLIHYSMEKEHQKIDKILEPYFHKEKNFRFSGRLDILSKNTIWELKCTSKISQEHQLQVVIYAWLWNILYPDSPRNVYLLNIRTGEKQVLKHDPFQFTQIVVSLLMNKYEDYKTLDDDEFAEKCMTTIEKYKDTL